MKLTFYSHYSTNDIGTMIHLFVRETINKRRASACTSSAIIIDKRAEGRKEGRKGETREREMRDDREARERERERGKGN